MNDSATTAEPSAAPPPGDGGEPRDGGDDRRAEPAGREPAHPKSSLWSRLWRSIRPSGRGSLREDLADALRVDAGSDTAFSPEERAMLHNILRLREVRVEDVMVPRADIDAIDQSTTIGDLMLVFEESGRSRMPVYRENLDDPRGMVHIRDLLAFVTKQARSRRRAPAKPAGPQAEEGEAAASPPPPRKHGPFDFSRVDFRKTVQEAGIIRNVLFVPPSMLASDLMERMQARRIQMALVIDEYGGTDGLVSLEDIVEMVVGDIEDEHDDEETMITRVSEDVFIADAKAELEDLAEMIGSDFDVREQIEDVDSLGGLLFAELGRVPARGEVVQAVPGFEFHVLDADPRRIKRVRIIRRRALVRRARAAKPDAAELRSAASPPPAGNGTTGPSER
ncbi:MAG: hemolysin family protein [Pararhizobium sp.]